ncbi:MAG: transketolase [Defluviitaleaceae bacterium]|nr:transketolase [Defluviitaleaceae bacterium]
MHYKQAALEMRKSIVDMIHHAKSGHPGGSLSATDILAYLYFEEMNVDPTQPKDPNRDRFVLSKGHAAPVLYTALAHRGFFDTELLPTLRKLESPLQGHPDSKKLVGVDVSTGSLGQGVSNAVGLALGAKLDNSSVRVYAVLGDGELQEGIVWEALMASVHYKLDNLVIIVDNNGLQIDGRNIDVMDLGTIDDKFRAFGLNTIEIDGHDYDQIEKAFATARETKGVPTAIVAKTIKGKGVSFMEDVPEWHGVAPSAEDLEAALKELSAQEVK